MRYRISRYNTILFKRLLFAVLLLSGCFYFFFIRGIDRVELYRRYHSYIQATNKLVNIWYVPRMWGPSHLPRYDLDIADEDLAFLNRNLPPLYENAVLTDAYKKPVRATLYAYGTRFDPKVRYRGDLDNHWRDPQKSFFFDFRKEQLFQGIEEMHLIIPADRFYLLEELTHIRARAMGLATPQSQFVNLFINGKRNGVYWQVAGFDKSMLERQGLPGDVNIYGAIDFSDTRTIDISRLDAWRKYNSDIYSDSVDNYADLETLLTLFFETDDDVFLVQLPTILAMDDFYSWMVLQHLTGSTHVTGANMRMFFDPTMGKFRMIPWDISRGTALPPVGMENNYNPFITRVLAQPTFTHERNLKLWEYAGNDERIAADLARYDELDALTRKDFLRDSVKVESNLAYRKRVKEVRKSLIEWQHAARTQLEDARASVTVRVRPGDSSVIITVEANGFSGTALTGVTLSDVPCGGTIRWYEGNEDGYIVNPDEGYTDLPCRDGIWHADVHELVLTGREAAGTLLSPVSQKRTFILKSAMPFPPLFSQDSLVLALHNAVTGKPLEHVSVKWVSDSFSHDGATLTRAAAEFAQLYPSFIHQDGTLFLRGSHVFQNDIIIPAGTRLRITAGATLSLGEGVSIYSYSPVTIEGSSDRPVTFTHADSAPWGVFLVANTTEESTVRYAVFEAGSEEYLNGIYSRGMLSFFHAPVTIEHSEFTRAHADDAVNINYGLATIRQSRFTHNQFDALDIDVTDSTITHNLFEDNGNDGIDISGARPFIAHNMIFRSGDKCISVGEDSQAIIYNNLLIGCQGYGVAVKDSSAPFIAQITAVHNTVGVGVYEKKEIFGGGTPRIFNSLIWGNGNSIAVDERSAMQISHSVIMGGWEGEGNSDLDPHLDSSYLPTTRTLPSADTSTYPPFPPQESAVPAIGFASL